MNFQNVSIHDDELMIEESNLNSRSIFSPIRIQSIFGGRILEKFRKLIIKIEFVKIYISSTF